jgi:hypothetical protein
VAEVECRVCSVCNIFISAPCIQQAPIICPVLTIKQGYHEEFNGFLLGKIEKVCSLEGEGPHMVPSTYCPFTGLEFDSSVHLKFHIPLINLKYETLEPIKRW